ncbi:hypothetical protein IF1G_07782 [Cordyceps javanica]|uniref:Uncharacterized protein n=1 Tax=Cordyceps javanica TaxID=43265 RepID=A0A545UUR5_9HYPO|nr:hypothetical protein IF1G_07782 [Cordyceps javanica]
MYGTSLTIVGVIHSSQLGFLVPAAEFLDGSITQQVFSGREMQVPIANFRMHSSRHGRQQPYSACRLALPIRWPCRRFRCPAAGVFAFKREQLVDQVLSCLISCVSLSIGTTYKLTQVLVNPPAKYLPLGMILAAFDVPTTRNRQGSRRHQQRKSLVVIYRTTLSLSLSLAHDMRDQGGCDFHTIFIRAGGNSLIPLCPSPLADCHRHRLILIG